MPGAIPPSRPAIYDAEWYNGTADLGSLHRKLVQWVRWTYGRDAYYKPCNVVSGDGDGLGSGNLGAFYVPLPTTPAQRLVMQVYVDLTVSTYTVDLALVGSRGNEKTVRVDTAALGGGGATAGWYEFTFPCAPDSVVEVTATASNAAVNVKSLCGWWEPLATGSGITVPGGTLSFISRTFCAQDRADGSYFLRRCALLMNRYAATRPRMVVATSFAFMGTQAAGTYDVARYKVFVGENVGSLEVDGISHSLSTSAGDLVFKLYEDGVLVATANSGAGATETAFGTVAVTKGAARVVEYCITVTFAAGSRWARNVRIYEVPIATADLGLASGDTVPAAFPTLDANAGRGGAPIMATGTGGRAGILDGLIWLYANRRRFLVVDTAFETTVVGDELDTYQYTARAAYRRVIVDPGDPPYDPWGSLYVVGNIYALDHFAEAPAQGSFGRWAGGGPGVLSNDLFRRVAATTNSRVLLGVSYPFCEFTGFAIEGAAVAVP